MDDDLIFKICTGEASSLEKEKWCKDLNLPLEFTDNMKEICNLGYKTASENDNSFNKNIEEIKKDINKIKEDIEEIKNCLKDLKEEKKT